MGATITVRASAELREALEAHAASLGKTLSEFVRDTLEDAVSERSIGDRAAHVAGKLAPAEWHDDWHRELRERNWRS
ncbi:MAG: ribbon-helix-helix protein, CopG family [Acidobacteriia bacterium]|nr:ribbon-helix-helix protein, CopG family [Terriglobia bacterium]MYG00822.1 ribbon-helix-helix protein, CopG family [Terriglobia bacterium]MYK10689.1 ribbon-helix-helix protein, CopG family [Terriglobia bacterium]